MLEGRDIICISPSDWECPWGSKQQIMSRLALNNRVFYVEYQASLLHIFRARIRVGKRLLNFFGRLRKINENLFVYTPPLYLLPFGYYMRAVNKLNQKMLSVLILHKIRKMGFKKPILWSYLPTAADLIKHFKESTVVYHCVADFRNEKENRLRRNTIIGMEDSLARRADIVAAMTEGLYQRFSSLGAKTAYFPSAVDFAHFYKTYAEDSGAPEDLKNIKKPILGVVGYLDAQVLDLGLLEYLLANRPQWSLVFVGPIFRDSLLLRRLRAKSNVYFLGGKKHSEVPLYIKFFDACLIPYRRHKFMENVSPLKLYEYLALGKPVVSTAFLKDDNYNGLIYIAGTREDFINHIEEALSEKDTEIVMRRIEAAKENSWDARIEAISGALSQRS